MKNVPIGTHLFLMVYDSLNNTNFASYENPQDAAAFRDCDDRPCYTDDSSYPVKSWMVDTIRQMVLQELGIMVKAPQDQVSDGKNSYKPTVTN